MTEAQEKKIDRIHEILVGSFEKKGLVHEMETMKDDVSILKTYKENDEKFKSRVAGGMAVGTPLLVGAWHWIIEIFKK